MNGEDITPDRETFKREGTVRQPVPRKGVKKQPCAYQEICVQHPAADPDPREPHPGHDRDDGSILR